MARHEDEANQLDRRAAIKKVAAGAATAGVVWTAPRIEGLSLRPNYAAAASGAAGPQNAVATLSGAGSPTFAFNGGIGNVTVVAAATGDTSFFLINAINTSLNVPGTVTWNGFDRDMNADIGYGAGGASGAGDIAFPQPVPGYLIAGTDRVSVNTTTPNEVWRLNFTCA